MRLLGLLILAFVLSFAMASVFKNTSYWRERQKQIYTWFCGARGGELIDYSAWHFTCEFTVNKKGEIIRP